MPSLSVCRSCPKTMGRMAGGEGRASTLRGLAFRAHAPGLLDFQHVVRCQRNLASRSAYIKDDAARLLGRRLGQEVQGLDVASDRDHEAVHRIAHAALGRADVLDGAFQEAVELFDIELFIGPDRDACAAGGPTCRGHVFQS